MGQKLKLFFKRRDLWFLKREDGETRYKNPIRTGVRGEEWVSSPGCTDSQISSGVPAWSGDPSTLETGNTAER